MTGSADISQSTDILTKTELLDQPKELHHAMNSYNTEEALTIMNALPSSMLQVHQTQ